MHFHLDSTTVLRSRGELVSKKGMGAFEMQQESFFAILQVPFAAAYCQTPRMVFLRRKRHLSDEQGPMERRPPAKRMLQTTLHGTIESSNQEALGKLHQFSDSTKVTCHDLYVQIQIMNPDKTSCATLKSRPSEQSLPGL